MSLCNVYKVFFFTEILRSRTLSHLYESFNIESFFVAAHEWNIDPLNKKCVEQSQIQSHRNVVVVFSLNVKKFKFTLRKTEIGMHDLIIYKNNLAEKLLRLSRLEP